VKSRTHKVGRGNVGTGELAHEWAHLLAQAIAERRVVVEDPGTEHGRALVRTLGAVIRKKR